MHHIFLIFAATVLASSQADVRHLKLLPELDNDIQRTVVKHNGARKFLTLTSRPSGLNAHRAGTTLELTCEALGSPAPTVHWLKNNAPLYGYDMESNELVAGNPSSLGRVRSSILVRRTLGADEYTCVVQAGLKSARATATVYSVGGRSAEERTRLSPLAPRIVASYKAFMGTIGSSVLLPCRVKGHPRPRVIWLDNRGDVVKNSHRMKTLRSGDLYISTLLWMDMGEFTCQATNVFGGNATATFVYPAREE